MARETRNEAEGQPRRRRSGSMDAMNDLKLAIPDEVRERYPDRTFRWINDTGNRMHNKTKLDDWDKCEGIDPVPVGTDAQGKPILAYLCAKLLKYYEEDQRAALAFRREQEVAMMRAMPKGDPEAPVDKATTYVPEGNSIQHEGGYTP